MPEPGIELRALAGAVAGAVASGTLLRIDGTRLAVQLAGSDPGFSAGTLVELNTPHHIYLGEIRSSVGGSIVIEAEHQLQKAMLEAIWQVWHQPAR